MSSELPALGLPGFLDGLDVSAVQGTVDYEKVAAAGFRFAVVKVAEGSGGVDSKGAAHLAGFRAAGMYALPYLFLHPSLGAPELQVANLARSLGTVWPGRVCLDIETRYQAESNAEIVTFLEGAVAACLRWGVLPPVVYSFPDYLYRLHPEVGRSAVLASCPLWFAKFPFQPYAPRASEWPSAPTPWDAVTLWQYGGDDTTKGAHGYRVPGVFGNVDRDLFRGTEDDFRLFLGLPAAPPAPPYAESA